MRSAFLFLLAACGPAVHPMTPAGPEVANAVAANAGASGPPAMHAVAARRVLVGEMCPEGAAGRPGVTPMFVHGADWKDEIADIEEPIAQSAVRQFAVLGEDGKRAGVFTVMGAADVGQGADVAIGSYTGGSVCALASTSGKPTDDPACVAATRNCGLAVAPIVPGQDTFGGGESDDAIAPATGTACVTGDSLVVDIDGDGAAETYSLSSFLDPVRAPADEVSATPTASPACKGAFAKWKARVDTGGEPGGATPDPKYKVEIDLVGVADVDGDGRKELFVAFRYPDRRTVAIYSATSTAARLDLVGEALPWQTTPSP
ncbi:MAG TPA: hypothetical protein VL463_08585 [Kofleriaceae bacterium]|nr:hypothetical protein [Kofleriaceae bacterium]